MPQDGSNNYYYPPGTPGIPDTTIESEAYNTFLDDLVINDLNIPRPIHRGGTGAITAHDALVALHGEEALQNVTNYDMFPFVSGSFHSAVGATAAPTAGAFAGICYVHATSGDMTIEARAVDDADNKGPMSVRQKRAGVWGAWVTQVGPASDLDAALALKVAKAGDTMTGDLIMTRLATPTTGYVYFGNTGTKYIGFDGTNIIASAGLNVTGPITATGNINTAATVTATGNINTAAALTANAGVWSGYSAPVGGSYFFGNNGTRSLTHDGTNFTFYGGSVNIASGNINAAAGYVSTTGLLVSEISGAIQQPALGPVVFSSPGQPMISFHVPGSYAINFGMDSTGHLYKGGGTDGSIAYRVWTAQDFAPPMSEHRIMELLDAITARLDKLEKHQQK